MLSPRPLLLSALICLGGCAPKVQPQAAPERQETSVTLLKGPWEEQGSALALAVTGPRTLAGAETGPRILVAAWVEELNLLSSTSFDGGRGWTRPAVVAEQVELTVDGRQRPELGLPVGGPVLAFVKDGAPHLVQRSGANWEPLSLPESARGSLLDLLVVDGEPVLLWVQPGTQDAPPSLHAWVDGAHQVVTEGVEISSCARPALGVHDGELVAVVLLAQESGWVPARIRQLSGEWGAPEPLLPATGDASGCPDGAAVWHDGGVVSSAPLESRPWLFSDGEALKLATEDGALQPRGNEGVGGRLVWVEQVPDRQRLMVGDLALIGSDGALVPGDPVPREVSLLVPWDHGGQARAAIVGP